MDSFLKRVFVRAGKHTTVHGVHPHKYHYFMADIANSDLFMCGYRTWICLDITRFYEEQRQSSSGSAWPACKKKVNWAPNWKTINNLGKCVSNIRSGVGAGEVNKA